MRFDPPLIRGTLLRRYKRFLADVRLDDGSFVTAHTPNTGSMKTCAEPGSTVWLSISTNPRRKLAHTWELASASGVLVGVHTHLANLLALEAIQGGCWPELQGYAHQRREVPYGQNSRVDILLEDAQRVDCYVEVKNVTWVREDRAVFPDAVSVRAKKHMEELARQVALGCRAAVLFMVQREDCQVMSPADDIDPAYGKALREAARAGVMVLACRARISSAEIVPDTPLPVAL